MTAPKQVGTVNIGYEQVSIPAYQDRYGQMFSEKDVAEYLAGSILTGKFFPKRGENMKKDFETATEVCETATAMFMRAMDRLHEAEQRLSTGTKKTSGDIRKAANEMLNGLEKFEKVAEFEKLDKTVAILERAAKALTTLAELEKEGKLTQILSAVTGLKK